MAGIADGCGLSEPGLEAPSSAVLVQFWLRRLQNPVVSESEWHEAGQKITFGEKKPKARWQ